MDPNVSTLERAFQLAAAGRYVTVTEIRIQLAHEGYRHELVEGPELAKQLIAIMAKARAAHTANGRRSR
jgi:hypothetical protein